MSAPTDPAGESVALEALLLARARLYALFHKLFGAAPDAAAIEALLGEATAMRLTSTRRTTRPCAASGASCPS